MKKTLLFIFCLLFAGGALWAQSRQVTGVVTDANDGSTLPGVSVLVKNTTTIVSADAYGHYSITVPDNAAVLVFTYIGYRPREEAVGTRAVVNVNLQPDVQALEEVIVTAYGIAPKGGFTGSAASMDAKAIELRPVTNISNVLEGLSGVQTFGSTGMPGSSASVRVRGLGSLYGTSTPMYVVDGFPFNGNINDISPDDIENVTVLKDASSTALFGSRAANGVIMVTTKRGKSGRLSVNFQTRQGFSTRGIPEYDLMNAYDWVPIQWEIIRNGLYYNTSGYVGEDIMKSNLEASRIVMDRLGYNPFSVSNGEVMLPDGTMNPNAKLLYTDDFDWAGASMRLGYRQEYSVSANGGSDRFSFMASANYVDEKGYAIHSDMTRMTGRGNIDFHPKDWIKFGINLSIASGDENNFRGMGSGNYYNPFFFSRGVGPIYPIHKHNPDGSYQLDENGNKIYEWDGRTFSLGRHSIAENEWNLGYVQRNSFTSRGYIEIDFLKNFRFVVNYGRDVSHVYTTESENIRVGDGAPAGRGSKDYSPNYTYSFDQKLFYDKVFGKNTINLVVGHNSDQYVYDSFSGSTASIIFEGNPELVNYTTIRGLSSTRNERTTEGYLFRGGYNYDDKYYLDISFRRDGTSRFYKDVRWGNFYSVGGTWRLDREDFLKPLKWVNMLKLRAAVGQVGNDRIGGNYVWQTLYSINRNYNAPGFIQQTTIGNRELTWETTTSINVAVEYALFNHRLTGMVEFYNRNFTDLLFNVGLPITSGVSSQPRNVGSLYNRGIEIELRGDIIKKQNFSWNASLNASHYVDVITKLPEETPTIAFGSSKQLEVGRSRYDWWIRTSPGVNPADGRLMFVFDPVRYAGSEATAAVFDYNGQTVTYNPNYALYEYHGTAIPKVYGSLTNLFRYKNFSLNLLATYSLGQKVIDSNYWGMMTPASLGYSKHVDMLTKRWKQPGDVTIVPRLDDAQNTNLNTSTNLRIQDGSFVALKSATLQYRLPTSICRALDISNINVYASGENLIMFAGRRGFNPTQTVEGTSGNTYDMAVTVTLGLNISF